MSEGCAGYYFVNAESIIQPFGFKSSLSLFLIVGSCFGGFTGAIFFGYFVKRTKAEKKFKYMLVRAQAALLVFFISFNLSLWTEYFPLVFALFFMLSFFVMPLITLSIELSVTISYPVPEAISAGLLTISGMSMAFSLSILSSFVLNESRERLMIFHGCLFILLVIMSIFNLYLEEKSLTRDYMEKVLKEERKIRVRQKKLS